MNFEQFTWNDLIEGLLTISVIKFSIKHYFMAWDEGA